jgi:hypothetical protein
MSETPTPPTLEQRAEQLLTDFRRINCSRIPWMPWEFTEARQLILSALQDVRAEALQEQKTPEAQ